MIRKTGLPRALEEEREILEGQSPEEFAKEFFPSSDVSSGASVEQEGLPSIEWLKSQFQTKSAAIRYLHSLGHQPKVIAKHLGIKYQHARNVCTTKLKRGPNEDWHPKKLDVHNEPEFEDSPIERARIPEGERTPLYGGITPYDPKKEE